MRDPDRLPKILAEIESIWCKLPDMRLGQLIACVAADNLFTIDDENLVQALHKMFDEFPDIRVKGDLNEAR